MLQHRILVGIPTLGTVRIEFHNAVAGLIVPTNWSNSVTTPINFLVADAQNIICHEAMKGNFDWVLFIEDDVVVPVDLFQRMRAYVDHARYPVVAGLYHVKTQPPEPMIYRGRGNGPFRGWTPGQLVRCDAVPTGCTLVSVKLIRAVADQRAETYTLDVGKERLAIRRVFETPRHVWTDPALGTYYKHIGTSDITFCDYVLQHKLLAKAGWPRLQRERHPFLVDTRICCGHIDRNTGRIY